VTPPPPAPDAGLAGWAGAFGGVTAKSKVTTNSNNKQRIWCQIRIFGDGQHKGDLPRVCVGALVYAKAMLQATCNRAATL
jgi:hypothetical protein